LPDEAPANRGQEVDGGQTLVENAENQPVPDFETALAELEEVVRTLEKGELTLEESLRLFERGVKMSRICTRLLNDAEGRIEKLIEIKGSEEAKRVPFEVEEGA